MPSIHQSPRFNTASARPNHAQPTRLRFQGELATRIADQKLLNYQELRELAYAENDGLVGHVPAELAKETGLSDEVLKAYLSTLHRRLYTECAREAVRNHDREVDKARVEDEMTKAEANSLVGKLWEGIFPHRLDRQQAFQKLDRMTEIRYLGSGNQGMVYHIRIGKLDYAFKVFRPSLMEEQPDYPFFEVAQAEFLTARNVRNMPRHYISATFRGWMLMEHLDAEKGKEQRSGPTAESLGFEYYRPARQAERFGNFRVDFGVALTPVTPAGHQWTTSSKSLPSLIKDTKAAMAQEAQEREMLTRQSEKPSKQPAPPEPFNQQS